MNSKSIKTRCPLRNKICQILMPLLMMGLSLCPCVAKASLYELEKPKSKKAKGLGLNFLTGNIHVDPSINAWIMKRQLKLDLEEQTYSLKKFSYRAIQLGMEPWPMPEAFQKEEFGFPSSTEARSHIESLKTSLTNNAISTIKFQPITSIKWDGGESAANKDKEMMKMKQDVMLTVLGLSSQAVFPQITPYCRLRFRTLVCKMTF